MFNKSPLLVLPKIILIFLLSYNGFFQLGMLISFDINVIP